MISLQWYSRARHAQLQRSSVEQAKEVDAMVVMWNQFVKGVAVALARMTTDIQDLEKETDQDATSIQTLKAEKEQIISSVNHTADFIKQRLAQRNYSGIFESVHGCVMQCESALKIAVMVIAKSNGEDSE
jgi:uncharacterized coiled-coil DUF342 family protein